MEWLVRHGEYYDRYRVGMMTIMITFQSCLGAVAAFLAIRHEIWILVGLSALLVMVSNAVEIANQKGKVCMFFFWLSVAVNTLIVAVMLVTL